MIPVGNLEFHLLQRKSLQTDRVLDATDSFDLFWVVFFFDTFLTLNIDWVYSDDTGTFFRLLLFGLFFKQMVLFHHLRCENELIFINWRIGIKIKLLEHFVYCLHDLWVIKVIVDI
jgi:hypothetical protein